MKFNLFKDNQVERELEKYTVTTEIVKQDEDMNQLSDTAENMTPTEDLEKTIVVDAQKTEEFTVGDDNRRTVTMPTFTVEDDEEPEEVVGQEEYDDDDEYEYITPHYLRNAILIALLFVVVGIVGAFFLSKDYLAEVARARYIEQGYILTSDANAAPADIAEGKTAYANGRLITGTYVDLDTSGATATADDILEGFTAYVKGEKITGTIPSYTGTTRITPGTKEIVIPQGVYLNNAITIIGDADLKEGNILAGVKIFGVTGTYTGE